MNNLLTLSYWFNANPGPFLEQYIKSIYSIIILILIGGFVAWFFIKKNKDDVLIQKFWQKVQSFCFTIGIVAGILVLCRQQEIRILSSPFLLFLIFIGVIIWLYFIIKYITKIVPKRKEYKEAKALKEKYL